MGVCHGRSIAFSQWHLTQVKLRVRKKFLLIGCRAPCISCTKLADLIPFVNATKVQHEDAAPAEKRRVSDRYLRSAQPIRRKRIIFDLLTPLFTKRRKRMRCR